MTAAEQDAVRSVVRTFAETKALVAERESARHARRLRELTAQQQKLVQLAYRELVSDEVLKAEQNRIEAERAEAKRWATAAVQEVEDVMQALDDALSLIDAGTLPYASGSPLERRLLNQALFEVLLVENADSVEGTPTAFYAQLVPLAKELATTTAQTTQDSRERGHTAHRPQRRARNDHGPLLGGHGSHMIQMAGRCPCAGTAERAREQRSAARARRRPGRPTPNARRTSSAPGGCARR